MIIQPRIVVSGNDILCSGTVISYGWQTVDLYPIAAAAYHVRLLFETQNDVGPATIIQQTTNTPSEVALKLINFDVLSVSSATPIHVGSYLNRKMYLSLFVHFTGVGAKGTRETAFTFYLGEAT
jgi:hypothetical protein